MISPLQNCQTKAIDLASKKCPGFTSSTNVDEEMTLDDDVIEKITKFLYFGDVISSKGRVKEAVAARIS